MKIKLYDLYGEVYTIEEIDYTGYNGKETVVDYSKDSNHETYTARFDGWLTIKQIVEKLYTKYGDE